MYNKFDFCTVRKRFVVFSKAQISLEFLVEFLILLVVIGMFLSALQNLENDAQAKAVRHSIMLALEENARATDILASSFRYGYVNLEAIYRIDNNRMLVKEQGRWLFTETLYGEKNEKEAV